MSEEAAQVFTHVVATDTECHHSGRQQVRLPEGALSAVTKVALLQEPGSYCRARNEGGIEMDVSTDDLRPPEHEKLEGPWSQ
jgi:hypothetical protein